MQCIYEEGMWIELPTPDPLFNNTCDDEPNSKFRNANTCLSSSYAQHNARFRWDFSKCNGTAHIPAWSRSRMGSYLRDSRSVFVGDSLTQQFMETLVFAIRGPDSKDGCGFVRRECEDMKDLTCPPITTTYVASDFNASISLIRSMMVSVLQRPVNAVGRHKKFENGWAFVLPTLAPRLLILNRGAHYVGDLELIAQLNETFAYLSQFPDLSIIFRSTNTGHNNWKTMTLHKPLTELSEVQNANEERKFYRDQFHPQNLLVKKLIETHYPHIVFMDIYPSTALRADLHPDGLHYCMPGPIDNWVRLLYTTLSLLKRHGKTQ